MDHVILFPENITWDIPKYPHLGSFGAHRRHDRHTGVDIYVPDGTPVYALENCRIADVSYFTGPNALPPCDWWEETWAVTVQNENSNDYLLYGEITPYVFKDEVITAGTIIGYIKRVLKNDKGLPTSMLHVEMYSCIQEMHPYWGKEESIPDCLLDPTDYLNKFKK